MIFVHANVTRFDVRAQHRRCRRSIYSISRGMRCELIRTDPNGAPRLDAAANLDEGSCARRWITSEPVGAGGDAPAGKANASNPRRRVDESDVDQSQLHAFIALPAVETQGAGRVHALSAVAQQRLAQRLAGGTEGDRRNDRAV